MIMISRGVSVKPKRSSSAAASCRCASEFQPGTVSGVATGESSSGALVKHDAATW